MILPQNAEGCGLHGVAWRLGTLWHCDLHPGRRKDGGLSAVSRFEVLLNRFLSIHALGRDCDPSLILADNSDHAGFIDIRQLDLVPYTTKHLNRSQHLTWVFHKPKIFGYLPLVLALLDGFLAEYLSSVLKVLLLVPGHL